MSNKDAVTAVADAMAKKREELIALPLSRVWPELAKEAIRTMEVQRAIKQIQAGDYEEVTTFAD